MLVGELGWWRSCTWLTCGIDMGLVFVDFVASGGIFCGLFLVDPAMGCW